MANVPIASREVSANLAATPYKNANLNGDMFGQNVYEAMSGINKARQNLRNEMLEIKNRIDDTKIMEAKNLSSKWVQEKLMDKENGYFYKTGKDAYGGSEALLNDYDKTMNEFIEKAGFSPRNKQLAKMTLQSMRKPILEGMYAHDYKSGVEWSTNVANESLDNYLTDAINSRNNPEVINSSLANGLKIIEWQGKLQHLDQDGINAKKRKYTETLLENVLNTKLGEGNLDASDFFEKYKNYFNPENLPRLISNVKNNELNYTARETANYLMTLPVDEANNKVENIKDYQTRDAVERNLAHLRSLKKHEQSEIYNNFLNVVAEKYKNNEEITKDDIPTSLQGEYYLHAVNQLSNMNKNGDVETEADTYTKLWYTADYDANRFKDMDLSMYRYSLSQKDYDDLAKRQQQIQKGDYFTIMTNTGSVKKYIEQITGINGNDERKVFEQYQNMVRSHEERTGKKVTDIEKEQFLKYLGSDKNNFKKIENAMKDNADFHKELANKISYYQARHNGDMPDSNMVNGWIKEQAIEYKSGKYTTLKNNAIQNTKRVANEQITLTNFADNYVPSLSKSMGVPLKITDRYRPANGRYTSRHSEGRALDISYTTQDGRKLTLNQKIKLVEEVIKRPDVEKIAISSKDAEGKAILNSIMKNYGKKYGSKIQDMNRADSNGKSRDENLGTNHTNHLHITLYRDNTFSGNDIIALKNQLKSRGFNNQQIDYYLRQKGLI